MESEGGATACHALCCAAQLADEAGATRVRVELASPLPSPGGSGTAYGWISVAFEGGAAVLTEALAQLCGAVAEDGRGSLTSMGRPTEVGRALDAVALRLPAAGAVGGRKVRDACVSAMILAQSIAAVDVTAEEAAGKRVSCSIRRAARDGLPGPAAGGVLAALGGSDAPLRSTAVEVAVSSAPLPAAGRFNALHPGFPADAPAPFFESKTFAVCRKGPFAVAMDGPAFAPEGLPISAPAPPPARAPAPSPSRAKASREATLSATVDNASKAAKDAAAAVKSRFELLMDDEEEDEDEDEEAAGPGAPGAGGEAGGGLLDGGVGDLSTLGGLFDGFQKVERREWRGSAALASAPLSLPGALPSLALLARAFSEGRLAAARAALAAARAAEASAPPAPSAAAALSALRAALSSRSRGPSPALAPFLRALGAFRAGLDPLLGRAGAALSSAGEVPRGSLRRPSRAALGVAPLLARAGVGLALGGSCAREVSLEDLRAAVGLPLGGADLAGALAFLRDGQYPPSAAKDL